jgi:hypothetical protein
LWWAWYPARTDCRCRSPKISIWSVISVLAVSTNRCAQAFAQGLRGGIFTAAMPGLAQGRAGGFGELPGAVADQEPEARGAVAEAHQEIADLLHSPRPVRIRGHARDVHVAGAGFDHKQAGQAPQGHRTLHVEAGG